MGSRAKTSEGGAPGTGGGVRRGKRKLSPQNQAIADRRAAKQRAEFDSRQRQRDIAFARDSQQ